MMTFAKLKRTVEFMGESINFINIYFIPEELVGKDIPSDDKFWKRYSYKGDGRWLCNIESSSLNPPTSIINMKGCPKIIKTEELLNSIAEAFKENRNIDVSYSVFETIDNTSIHYF